MENNSNINKPKTWRMPNIQINTTIDPELHREAVINNISWKYALEFGLTFLLAEEGKADHPSNSFQKKINNLVENIKELNKEIEELKKNGVD